MRPINAVEKTRLADIAEDSFSDTCSIHVPTISQDSYGEQTKTYTTTNDIPCGYFPKSAVTTYRGAIITNDSDAVLRLSLTQSLDDKSEITVRGVRYSIDGITAGLTVKTVNLKKVVADE